MCCVQAFIFILHFYMLYRACAILQVCVFMCAGRAILLTMLTCYTCCVQARLACFYLYIQPLRARVVCAICAVCVVCCMVYPLRNPGSLGEKLLCRQDLSYIQPLHVVGMC